MKVNKNCDFIGDNIDVGDAGIVIKGNNTSSKKRTKKFLRVEHSVTGCDKLWQS